MHEPSICEIDYRFYFMTLKAIASSVKSTIVFLEQYV